VVGRVCPRSGWTATRIPLKMAYLGTRPEQYMGQKIKKADEVELTTSSETMQDDVPFNQIGVHPLSLAALGAAIVPFLVTVGLFHTASVDGQVVISFFDPVAAIGGLAAVLLGGLSALKALRGDFRARLPLALAFAGAGVVFGLYHAARGFGLIGVPPMG